MGSEGSRQVDADGQGWAWVLALGFWRTFRGLARLEIDDFGVSRNVFYRTCRGLSGVEMDDFRVFKNTPDALSESSHD